MVQAVGDDRILRPQQRLEQTAIGVETGGEQDRIILAQELRQALLQLAVNVLGAADEADGGHAKTLVIHDTACCRDKVGMIRQTEIIVGAQIDDLSIANPDLTPLRGGDHSFPLVETIGFDLF